MDIFSKLRNKWDNFTKEEMVIIIEHYEQIINDKDRSLGSLNDFLPNWMSPVRYSESIYKI